MHAHAQADPDVRAVEPKGAGLPNGLHHLAIATRDVKAQVEFFTDVIGLELVALYWMHGVADTVHAFLRLSDTATIALVQGPEMQRIEPQLGVSHAGFTAGDVAPGAVQHIALNVDTEADLLAMRDRIRSRDHWVMGPIDHGMCKSIYLAGPEGMQLEFSTWTGVIDANQWIDPEVMAFCGIDAADVARYRRPAPFASRGGAVPQPDPAAKPNFVFPEANREFAAMLAMSDAEIAAMLDHPEPPVPA
jgi:catechol 2,3-dioxygenase-like lactoylglutathione lyase family enzyme